jgi:predicted enzyme related to lactoylglutathione lyase
MDAGAPPASLPPPPLAVAAVMLFSDDAPALVRFYREVVGVALRPVRVAGLPEHWACDVGRVYVSIWPAQGPEGRPATAGCGGIALCVRDAEAEFRRLVDAGVRPVFAPRRTVMGTIGRLLDPDGNVLEVYQPLPR